MADRSRKRQTVRASATGGKVVVERVGDTQAEINFDDSEMQMLNEGELGELIEALQLVQIGIRRDRMRKNGDLG